MNDSELSRKRKDKGVWNNVDLNHRFLISLSEFCADLESFDLRSCLLHHRRLIKVSAIENARERRSQNVIRVQPCYCFHFSDILGTHTLKIIFSSGRFSSWFLLFLLFFFRDHFILIKFSFWHLLGDVCYRGKQMSSFYLKQQFCLHEDKTVVCLFL